MSTIPFRSTLERADLDRSVVVGALLTVVATKAVLLVPNVIEFRRFQQTLFAATGFWLYDDPFIHLRVLGGIPGGLAASYLATDWTERVSSGVKAPLVGLVAFYVLDTAYIAVRATIVLGELPPLLPLVLQPLIFFLVPFGLVYAFEGLLSSAYVLVVVQFFPTDGVTSRRDRLVRGSVAALSFLLAFVVAWYFLFYVETAY